MNDKATARPWKITEADRDPRYWTIRGPKGEAIAYAAHWLDSDPLGELADALLFAVDAVNSHDKLKADVERLREALQLCIPSACQAQHFASPNYKDGAPCGRCAYCKARAALRETEPKP